MDSSVPTILTMSTIPPRFKELGPTFESLHAQNLPLDEIRLYIPRSYRRFKDWDGTLPEVPPWVTIYRCDTDLGPASKVLPSARELRGQAVDLLFCDDDKIYDRDWHARFKNAARRHPDTCIVEVGETFPDIADDHRPIDRLPRGRRAQKDVLYRLKRIFTLTMHKPHLYRNSGYVDQISGYGGVLVRPDWFDDAAFDIPDIMWLVDDPWLSGHLERAGVPIWLNGKGKGPRSTRAGHLFGLLQHVEDGHDRVDADLAVIEYFRRNYGIWKKCGKVDRTFPRMTNSMKELARRRRAELSDEGS